jgi:hypothetical protein
MTVSAAMYHLANALGESRDELYGALLVAFTIVLFLAVEVARSR